MVYLRSFSQFMVMCFCVTICYSISTGEQNKLTTTTGEQNKLTTTTTGVVDLASDREGMVMDSMMLYTGLVAHYIAKGGHVSNKTLVTFMNLIQQAPDNINAVPIRLEKIKHLYILTQGALQRLSRKAKKVKPSLKRRNSHPDIEYITVENIQWKGERLLKALINFFNGAPVTTIQLAYNDARLYTAPFCDTSRHFEVEEFKSKVTDCITEASKTLSHTKQVLPATSYPTSYDLPAQNQRAITAY
eukprot:GHVL01013157.1.p1 GENE.GHVL01013157.1~~GHVL01013157.1.p1  ORF type:complete len:245 (+),score=18.30 GHVL01013157.1:81-815(+)